MHKASRPCTKIHAPTPRDHQPHATLSADPACSNHARRRPKRSSAHHLATKNTKKANNVRSSLSPVAEIGDLLLGGVASDTFLVTAHGCLLPLR